MCWLHFKNNFYYRTCSLRFGNNFLTIARVRFSSKIISLLSNVFTLLRYRRKPHYRIFRLLSFQYRCVTIMGYSGAWVKLIHEKKTEVKNLVTLSLKAFTFVRI